MGGENGGTRLTLIHKIILWIVAMFFAWFIWPTPYSTVYVRGMARSHYNRFTGAQCDVTESCWFKE